MVSPLQILGRAGVTGTLQQMVFVGNIERCQDGKTRRIDSMGLLRHSPHLGIDVLSQFNDVIGVGAAKIIGLIENFHSDSIIAGIFQRWMFSDGRHNFAPSGCADRISSLPPVAPRQWFQSVAASSPRAPGYLPAPCAA